MELLAAAAVAAAGLVWSVCMIGVEVHVPVNSAIRHIVET